MTEECASNCKPLHPHAVSAIHHCQFIWPVEQKGRRCRIRLRRSVITTSQKMNYGYFYALLQPPPGSVGAVVVVEGYVTYNVRACTCLWWYLSVRTRELIVKVLAVISGSSNLEPRGSRRCRRQNRRTRRLLCTEPEQLKWQHRQMAVSDQVIDWTRLVLFSQTGNK